VAYHLKSNTAPYLNDLLSLSVDAVGHADHAIKMNGLKLLGSVLSGMGETSNPIEETTLVQLVQLLQSVANIDPTPEARQLAEKYLVSLGCN